MFINKKNREELKAHVKATIGDMPGVVGVGVGNKCIHVYVLNENVLIPSEIDNIPIKAIVTGKIVAQ